MSARWESAGLHLPDKSRRMLKKARLLTRPTPARQDAPFREQGRSGFPHFLYTGGLVDPRLRASNEHLPSVRVPRAGGRPGYPFLPFSASCYEAGGSS